MYYGTRIDPKPNPLKSDLKEKTNYKEQYEEYAHTHRNVFLGMNSLILFV